MASNITLAKDFDSSKLTYSDVKVLDNGGKTLYVSYNRAPLVLQTPEMSAPFGMQKWTNDNRDKYTLDLSFKNMDNRPPLQVFYDALNKIDTQLVEDAFKNKDSWFKGKKLPSLDVVEALYTPLIKHAKDKDTGEVTDKYPPTFKMNVPFKDGSFACEVYDDKRNLVDLSTLETKGARVTALIQCTGVWLAGGKFGSSWKVVQMKVVPSQRIKGYAFRDNPEDKMVEEDLASEDGVASNPSGNDEVHEDEDDAVVSDSEDEIEATPPKKKVVLKRKT